MYTYIYIYIHEILAGAGAALVRAKKLSSKKNKSCSSSALDRNSDQHLTV